MYFNGGTGNLDYVTVRYGGSGGSGNGWWSNVSLFDVQDGIVRIQHSRILDVGNLAGNTVHGLNVTNSHLELNDTFFSGNAVESGISGENEGYPMSITGANSVVTMTGNIFTGNLNDRVLIGGEDAMTANAQVTLYRQTTLEGYEFPGGYIIPAGMTLTVEPGVTLMSRLGAAIQVGGQLQATGTAAQPIIFTSAANTGPEQWAGLYFNGGTGDLDYVTVRYGGSGGMWWGWGNVALFNVQDGIVRIQHSRILDVGNLSGSTVHGLIARNSRLELNDTFFSGNAVQSGISDNEGYPLSITGANSVVTMTGNIFTGNLNDRVLIDGWDAMTANAQVTLYRQAALEGYEFPGSYLIPAGMTLNVEPGVTLMGRWGTAIQVDGRLEAIGTAAQPITFTSAANTGPEQWAGLYFNGGTGDLDYVTVRYGGSGGSYRRANISLLNVSGEGVQISNSLITHADSPSNSPSGVRVENSIAVITNTVFGDIGSEGSSAALNILGADSQVQLTNVAVIRTSLPGGGGKAIRVDDGANLVAIHTTIASNQGDGISVNGATAVFTNTILSQNSTGVRVENNGSVTLTQTLWDRNTTPVIGTIEETGHLEGLAGLAQDGYHLTRYSAAIGQGAASDVALDVDGEARPQPAGTQPDLGADEYLFNPLEVFDAEQTAFTPVWVFTTDPVSGDPVSQLQQDYLLRYFYGSPQANPPALNISIQDILPDDLNYASDTHYPEMSFAQSGSQLIWALLQPVQKDEAGEIILHTTGTPAIGQILTNVVTVTTSAEVYPLQISTIVPVNAPILLSPGTGEYCPHISGAVTLHGVAQPDVEIRVYENGTQVISQTVTTGEFNLTYNSTHAGVDAETLLEVRACALVGAQQCSEPTAITLEASQSFWCPQESIWEGTPTVGPLAGQHLVYGFRDAAGEFSSQNWVIPGVYGFWDTDLTLVTGYCPGTTELPTTVWLVADGTHYDPQPGGGPVYHFDITGAAHTVTIASNCDETLGVILIDPDGYVFDSTLGFDTEDPSAHVLPGATVTAYEYVPGTASWRPWPAHLYNDQVNPQVVGANGYFAFFTPPGQYYLQVDAPDGYQSWRSPVVEVVNEIVHVNVPLTPFSTPAVQQIQVTPSGLSLPQVTIRAGQSIMWTADNSWLAPDQYISFSENPIQHILSELNPLENVLGFDSGRMIPGQGYIHQFTRPGSYSYTDGYGHTGQVVVEPFRIFLPLALQLPGR